MRDRLQFRAQLFHFLGEVEAVFGIWLIPLAIAILVMKGWSTLTSYAAAIDPAEPIDRSLGGGGGLFLIRDIERDGKQIGVSAEPINDRLRVPCCCDNCIAFGERSFGDQGAEPAGCAGDDASPPNCRGIARARH